MTAELAVPEPHHSQIPDAAAGLVQWAQSADAAYQLAQRIITTSFAPAHYRGKPDEAAAAMLAGAEVGLSPMASLRAFDVIQGVAAPRAIAYRAIVQSLGHELVITEQSPTRVVAQGRRRGSATWQTVIWTIERAQKLGLTNKDQWKKQPMTMLIARATSECARLIAADAILGIPNTVEELYDAEPAPTTTISREPVKPRTVQRKPPTPAEPEEPAIEEPAASTEPAPAEEEAPDVSDSIELINQKQLGKMMALFNAAGFKDRDDRLAYVEHVLNEKVATSKDLTKDQASRVIDALEDLDRTEELFTP